MSGKSKPECDLPRLPPYPSPGGIPVGAFTRINAIAAEAVHGGGEKSGGIVKISYLCGSEGDGWTLRVPAGGARETGNREAGSGGGGGQTRERLMHPLDTVLLIVVFGSLFWGCYKGVITQAGSLGGVVFGVLLCWLAGPWLARVIDTGGLGDAAAAAVPGYATRALAGLILFVAGFLTVKAVAGFFKSVTHSLSLGFFDRLAGGLFCLLQWLLLLSLLCNLWNLIRPQTDWGALSTLGNGHAIEFVLALAPRMLGWALG